MAPKDCWISGPPPNFNKNENTRFFGFPKNLVISNFLEIQLLGCRVALFDPKIKFGHRESQYVRLVGACIVMMYMRTARVYQCMHQPLLHPLARCIHRVAGRYFMLCGLCCLCLAMMFVHCCAFAMIDDHDATPVGLHHQPAQLFMCGLASCC